MPMAKAQVATGYQDSFSSTQASTDNDLSVQGKNDVILYPNPASNYLNVIFNPDAGIKNIAIYNLIGRVVSVFRVSGNSAKLDIDNTPSGIYFVRLMTDQGEIIATRKFTRQ
jgi:hypothetical protein